MKHYKTLLFDFDGTLLDTSVMHQYKEIKNRHRRYTKEWSQDLKEYLSHISECLPYEGWPEVWKYLAENHIQAAIVTSNGHDVMNEAVKQFGLKDVFPKDKINRIGGKDATGKQIWKFDGSPLLFQHALKQLNIEAEDAIAFGNEICDAQAASNAGIKAYHCLWGAKDEEREQMMNDPDHPYITSPLQIIDILEETATTSPTRRKNTLRWS